MEYRIDREALDDFIRRQVELVEAISIPEPSEGARSSSRWSVYATSHGGASAASCYSRMQ